jgi:hypothetical protein
MVETILVLTILAFFGLCVLYVRACDVIIGPDEDSVTENSVTERPPVSER